MNIAAFEAFIKVMETGSISIAAQKLFVTQPAVTKRIHNLEDYLGIKLFDSVGRGIQPNQTAHQILPRVKQWLYELEDIQRDASQAHYHIQGKLKIGTSHHIGLHHLHKHLKPFAQDYPLVELEVQFVDSEQAHQLVLSGDIELAFLTLPPQPDPRLHYQLLWEDPLFFVAAPFHPLVQHTALRLDDLIRYPSLLPAAHTYTSQITLAEFEKHQLKPRVSMSTNPLEAIRMLVSIGLGWSVLPKNLINHDLQILSVDVYLQRELGMVWHPERSQSKAMQTLMQSIMRHEG
jgi:DNA-binding transcriptional LysR family regulator